MSPRGDLFAESGGVPVPGAAYDGAFIRMNPDVDLTDPALNTSGVPWHTLYCKENYPPLQRIKASGIHAICSGMRCRFG